MSKNIIGKVASIVSAVFALLFGLSMNLGVNLIGILPSRVLVVFISLFILVAAIFALIAEAQNF